MNKKYESIKNKIVLIKNKIAIITKKTQDYICEAIWIPITINILIIAFTI